MQNIVMLLRKIAAQSRRLTIKDSFLFITIALNKLFNMETRKDCSQPKSKNRDVGQHIKEKNICNQGHSLKEKSQP